MTVTNTTNTPLSIVPSNDHTIIQRLSKEWEEESARIQGIYDVHIQAAQGNTKQALTEEKSIFNEHETLSWLINGFAASAVKNPFLSKVSFYLCLNNQNQTEGMMLLSNSPNIIAEEPFLKLECLVTHPKNIKSTINLELPPPIRGAGTALLQKAEKVAQELHLTGVYLLPTKRAVSFYEHSGYTRLKSAQNVTPMSKRIEQAAEPLLNAGNF